MRTGWISSGSTLELAKLGAVTGGALLLAALPTRSLDALPGLCLFRALGFDHCPGCGMTHALSFALHGRWHEALAANWRVALVGPILAGAYAKMAWTAWRGWTAAPRAAA